MGRVIIEDGNPILRKKASEVAEDFFGTTELKTLLKDMSEAMRATDYGVAIAAPQIGVSKRIFMVRGFVMAGNEKNDTDPDIAFINPVIIKTSKKKYMADEGCLSVPDIYGHTERFEKTTVEAYDYNGKKFIRGGSELLAQIFQHEIEHLNGTLFIDHATDLHKSSKKEPEEKSV